MCGPFLWAQFMTQDLCTIVAKPHPFASDTVYCTAKAGMTIAQMLGQHASQTISVTIDGYEVPQSMWAKVRPKAGRTTHVVMYPQGGGNGSKWIRAILTIIVIWFAWWAAPLLAGAGATAGTIAAYTAGISMVGMMAINALIPPPGPKALNGGGGDPFQQLNSLTGTSN